MTDYIALVGSKGAGKTCFMGGLHAKYETAPPFPMFAKVKREEFEGEGWYHCVNFCIDRL
jgi:tRNA A37 threonylcarbamoyladenosine biosynthesis protein TsaE